MTAHAALDMVTSTSRSRTVPRLSQTHARIQQEDPGVTSPGFCFFRRPGLCAKHSRASRYPVHDRMPHARCLCHDAPLRGSVSTVVPARRDATRCRPVCAFSRMRRSRVITDEKTHDRLQRPSPLSSTASAASWNGFVLEELAPRPLKRHACPPFWKIWKPARSASLR